MMIRLHHTAGEPGHLESSSPTASVNRLNGSSATRNGLNRNPDFGHRDPVTRMGRPAPLNGHHDGRHANESSRVQSPLHRSPSVGLAPEIIADPMLSAQRRAYASGDTIIEHQDQADRVFLIHRGQVRVYQDAPEQTPGSVNPHHCRLVSILGPNDWFGATALADANAQTGIRAVSHGSSVVSSVNADRLVRSLATNPPALLALVRDLAVKLDQARDDTSGLIFDDCQRRLIRKLIHLSRTAAAVPLDDGGVELRITHHQIAQAIGVARETVSLALGEMRSRGLLSTGRNRLTFQPTDLEGLLASA